jgi:hypothetical protein
MIEGAYVTAEGVLGWLEPKIVYTGVCMVMGLAVPYFMAAYHEYIENAGSTGDHPSDY